MTINICQLVTNRIIAKLEKGHVPWNKPWTGTGKPYSLLNQLLLVRPGKYLTYKQAQAVW